MTIENLKILNYPLDLESLQTKAKATFTIMNNHLANRQFLAIDHPTVADIACFPYTAMAGEGGYRVEFRTVAPDGLPLSCLPLGGGQWRLVLPNAGNRGG